MVGGVRQPTSRRRKERPPGVGMAGARGAEDLQQPSIFLGSIFDWQLLLLSSKHCCLLVLVHPSKTSTAKHNTPHHNKHGNARVPRPVVATEQLWTVGAVEVNERTNVIHMIAAEEQIQTNTHH